MNILAIGLIGYLTCVDAKSQQTLGISGQYLITSIGLGNPIQYFDLAIELLNDQLVVVDQRTQDLDLDYQYDYVKALFASELTNTGNLTDVFCRRNYVDSNSNKKFADGHYVVDAITLGNKQYPTFIRFCNLDTRRTAASTSSDPLNWLMTLPIDGFLGLKPDNGNVLKKVLPADQPQQITFYINKNVAELDSKGYITFGGMDTEHCGKFIIFPSDEDVFSGWVTGTSFNGIKEGGTFDALFDLAIDGLVLPSDVYGDIVYYFGGKTKDINCNGYPNIPILYITLYGNDYKIPISDYFVSTSSNYCQLKITKAQGANEDRFVIGRTFLNNYCLLFDYDESSIGISYFK